MSDIFWTVYIIQVENGNFYTGITTDLERRFTEHQTHKKGARFFHLSPASKIVHTEIYPTRSEALKRESALKKMTRAAKIELMGSQSE